MIHQILTYKICYRLISKERMKIFTIILLLNFSLITQSFGQVTEDTTSISKNTVYFELLGNGGTYSLNYDRILFSKNLIKAAARVGLSDIYQAMDKRHLITFPSEISFLYGKKHNIEFGFGYSFNFLYNSKSKYLSDVDFYPSSLLLRLSYRFQKPNSGFFFKAGISIPTVLLSGYRLKYFYSYVYVPPSYDPWPGLSFGYTFKNKK